MDFILFQGREYIGKCKTHRLKVIHKKISISNHNLFVVDVQKPTRLILSCNRKIYYKNLCRKKNILKHIMNICIAAGLHAIFKCIKFEVYANKIWLKVTENILLNDRAYRHQNYI